MKAFIPRNIYACLLTSLAVASVIADVGAVRLRLVGSVHNDRGRAEIYHNGQWGTICDDGWDDNDATAFCKSMGYRKGEAYGSAHFGAGHGQIWLDNVNCGVGSTFGSCPSNGWGTHDCSHSEDAGVRCFNSSDLVRLVGTGHGDRGRVEVYHNRVWGTVCDDAWDNTDATVVCKTLGFIAGIALSQAAFGQGTGTIWLDDVNCKTGSPTAIQDCQHRGWGVENCGHSEDAGVRCLSDVSWGDWTSWTDCSVTCGDGMRSRTRSCVPDNAVCAGNSQDQESCSRGISCTGRDVVRLAGSSRTDRGRVEVYHNSRWGTICDDGWDNTDATVVCKTLGFRHGKAMNSAQYGSGSGTIWMDNVNCLSASTTDIKDCRHNGWGKHDCSHSEDAGVLCANVISWSDWTSWTDCSVTCGDGMRSRTRSCNEPFPALNVTACAGNPQEQESCSKAILCTDISWGDWTSWTDCSVTYGDGIRCICGSCRGRDVVRLAGSSRTDRGRVEVYHNSRWGTICDDGWDNTDATVVCKTLGFRLGKAMNGAHFGSGSGTIWMDNVNCLSASTKDIKDCQHRGWGTHDCSHSEDAGVLCANVISWSDWTSWTDCSVTCGDGMRSRTRSCNDPFPALNVTACAGNHQEQESCSKAISCTGVHVVRLAGSGQADRGRVEVYHNSRWGTICHDGWDNTDATVVCKTFGYRYGKAMNGAHFGSGSGTIWMDNVNCLSASDIKDCQHNGWGTHDCDHSDDAGVICANETSWSGWTAWSDCSVTCGSGVRTRTRSCDDPIPVNVTECPGSSQDQAVCLNNMPCTGAHFGEGSGQIWLDDVDCSSGTPMDIRECEHDGWGIEDCSHSEDAGVRCYNDIRLKGSNKADRGRVEVYHNNQWGSICNNDWDNVDAAVVCRMLGFSSGRTDITRYGTGISKVWLDSVNCSVGSPTNIMSCSHPGWGTVSCSSSEYAAVQCISDCKEHVDLAFVIDESGSVGKSNFIQGLTFIKKVIDVYEIAANKSRVAALTFGSMSEIHFNFDRYNTKPSVIQAVQGITYGSAGSTRTAKALDAARNVLFSASRGDRPGVQNVCVVLTDGNSNSNSQTLAAAARLKDTGTHVFSIGIGDSVKESELRGIASTPSEKYYLQVDSYETLQTDHLSELVSNLVCEAAGTWNNWREWSPCTTTCGGGTQQRRRACAERSRTRPCEGDTNEYRQCNEEACPIHGLWGRWSQWSDCSTTCGNGRQQRSRGCDSPAPSRGGNNCVGLSNQDRPCSAGIPCPVHGLWGRWSQWSDCSTTCGNGRQQRSRGCDSPAPSHGGNNCVGLSTEDRQCSAGIPCPVHGLWGRWSQWSDCSTTCGNGRQQRSRGCDSPAPSRGGNTCVGLSNQDRPCSAGIPCPVHGLWGRWSKWSDCSTTCGNGRQQRSRGCDSPAPSHGGNNCVGLTTEDRQCSAGIPCPVHGLWGRWSQWSDCSTTCGNGRQQRSRGCDSPAPSHGGNNCVGLSTEDRRCSAGIPCPVDGGWNQWSGWTLCSVTCADGTQERSRNCNNPAPLHGGRQCPGLSRAVRNCDTEIPCPVDGEWNDWLSWSACSVTCGQGLRRRLRYCQRPSPRFGGRDCAGNNSEEEECRSLNPCPIDGGWSQWSIWSQCSATCANGTQVRSRDCNDPVPMHGGRRCTGFPEAIRICDTKVPCPVDGRWSQWSGWSQCSATCASGTQERSRDCNDPAPMHGGRRCTGPPKAVRKCDTKVPCPVDGGWSQWSGWSQCSATCANGTQVRSRDCNDPAPMHGGRRCTVDGRWSQWSGWSQCSATCASGTQERSRDCNDPAPMHGGRRCTGPPKAVRKCDTKVPCPVDGGWSQWSGWSQCSATCANGTQVRSRDCNDPAPMHGGRRCTVDGGWSQWSRWSQCSATCANGSQERSRDCNDPAPMHGGRRCTGFPQALRICDTKVPCPVDGGWSQWSGWSQCSVTCANGTQERSRDCNDPAPIHGGSQCSGLATAVRNCDTTVPCPVDGGWSQWSGWSQCSVTCANGTQERSRDCNDPAPIHGGSQCSGLATAVRNCDTTVPCPVDGSWNNWSEWTPCSVTCSNGTQMRSRVCDNPAPMHGGNQCSGKASSQKKCHTSVPCPIDGGWSKWSDWSVCSVTCGNGTQQRSRACDSPAPAHGGSICPGNTAAVQTCDSMIHCPVDGSWTTWSEWSSCSVTCDDGIQERSRSCNDPPPQHGGENCHGNNTETIDCDAGGVLCPGSCAKNEFRCHSSTPQNKQCVKLSFRCDNFPDCTDNSDELDCDLQVGCPEGQFKCSDGQCVKPGADCDGQIDCADGSDESEEQCSFYDYY